MSLINRLHGTKSSSFGEIKCNKPDRGSSSDSIPKPAGDNSTDGTSLFMGMTISSTLSSQSNEGLLDSASSTPTKEQRYSQHLASDMQDSPTVLDTQESTFLPDPMLPIPVIKPEGPSLGKKKIKKHCNVVRPGYARKLDKEQNQTSEQIAVEGFNMVEREDVYVVEPKPMTSTSSSESIMAHDVPHSTPLVYDIPHPISLYSIGTPSSSDENLFANDSQLEKEISSEICQENIEADDSLEISVQTQQVIEPFEMPLVQKEEETLDTRKIDELVICSDNSSAAVTQTTVHDTMIDDGSTQGSKKDKYVEIIEGAQKDTDCSKFCHSNLHQIQDTTEPSSGLGGNQKLGILLQHTALQLAALSESKKSVADIERELIAMYGSSSGVQQSTKKQIKELQLKENQALASDNYDLAEELGHQIDELQQDLDSARYKIPVNDTKVKEALRLREEIAEKEVEIYRENLSSLQQLTEKQQASLVRHQAVSAAWNIKEKQLLNSEQQRLERAMGHLNLDQEHLEKESSTLQREILVRTKEFHERKEGLIKQKELLQEEISSLEMKLTELKLQEAEFTYAIEQEENNIEIAKTQFSPQQKMLDKQKLDIEGRQKTLDHEFELLTSAQKKFDDEVAEQSLKEQELVEIFAVASDEIEKSTEVISAIEKQRRRIQQFLNMEHFTLETDPELASLHTEQKEVSQEITNLTDKVQKVQRGLTTIKKALNEIESQISDLDAAKEIAKQERNFREAKRLKEERELLTKEGVKNQTQLESMLEELTDNKKLLEKARRKGEAWELQINEQERSSALLKVEKASIVVQSLQHQIHRLRGDTLLTTLLQAEVYACWNLIADLCDKHDILKPDAVAMKDGSYGHTSDEETPSYNEEAAELTDTYEELIDELNELEGRLEAVVDVEDFNEAERLQQEIDKLNERLKRVGPVE